MAGENVMNIGIDLDGVLTDIQKFNLKYAPPYFLNKFNRSVVDPNPYDIRDVFCCPENEYKAYWGRYLLQYAIFEPARPKAKETISKLQKDGHIIYIISKRVFTCKKNFMGLLMRTLFRNWLWRNKIPYDAIIFCDNDVPDSKKVACLENNIDVMIDDDTTNIAFIDPTTKIICYDTSYNRDCESENITRVYDWNEIYESIKILSTA